MKSKTRLIVFIFGLVLLASFYYTFSLEQAWYQRERTDWNSQYLLKSTASNNRLLLAFDSMMFENTPNRSTRILASFLEIFDTEFRVWLWQFISPHPSISLTLIFSYASLIFLFLYLRNTGFSIFSSFCALTIYTSSPGFLSLLSMRFRSSKPLSSFIIILGLYLYSILRKKTNSSNRNSIFFLLYLFLTINLLWDETVIVLIPALFILWKNKKNTLHLFFTILGSVLTYFLLIKYFFPYVQSILDIPSGDIQKYDIVPLFDTNELLLFLKNLPTNILINLNDLIGFVPIHPENGIIENILFIVNLLIVISLFVHLVVDWQHTPNNKLSRLFTYRISFFILLLIVFNAFLLSRVTNKIWGLYWYGVFIPIFFSILWSQIGRIVNEKIIYILATISISISSLVIFHYTNYSYKKFHYYPLVPLELVNVFTYKKNRFQVYNEDSSNRYLREEIIHITSNFYKKEMKSTAMSCVMPQELEFVPLEITRSSYIIPSQEYFFNRQKDYNYSVSKLCKEPSLTDISLDFYMYSNFQLKRSYTEFYIVNNGKNLLLFDSSSGRKGNIYLKENNSIRFLGQIIGYTRSLKLKDFNNDGFEDLVLQDEVFGKKILVLLSNTGILKIESFSFD